MMKHVRKTNRKNKILICAISGCVLLSGCANPFEEGGDPVTAVVSDESSGSETASGTEQTGAEDDSSITAGRLVSVESVEPYVTIGPYKGLRLVAPGVSDQDVEQEISRRLEADSSNMKGDNVVQAGDTVVINYVGTVGFATLPGTTAKSYILRIGSGEMAPGFEDALLGMKTGETRSFRLTYPADEVWGELSGVTMDFRVTLQSFTRPAVLTDQWAQDHNSQSAQEYREAVRRELEEAYALEGGHEQEIQDIAWQVILDRSQVLDLPAADLESAGQIFDATVQRYGAAAGLSLDAYLASQKISKEEYQAKRDAYARERTIQNLILQGIMDAEGMSLDDEISRQILLELVAKYGAVDEHALVEAFGQQETNTSVALERVLRFVAENANQDEISETVGSNTVESDMIESETVESETVEPETFEEGNE